MLLVLLSSVFFALFYFISAHLNAMPARSWACAGFVMGPIAMPMFIIAQHVAKRKAAGYNNMIFNA